MSAHRFGVTNLAESSGPSNLNIFHGINPTPAFFINQGRSGFNIGELEQAIEFHQGAKMDNDDIKASLYTAAAGGRAATATLEMFPSWPMKFQQPHRLQGSSNSRGESSDSGSALNAVCSSKAESESPISSGKAPFNHHHEMASDIFRAGPSQNQAAAATSKQPLQKRQGATGSEKLLDAKALRRLAQNREAARKCRIRKKAYVQQLETSRIRLAQLEQDLQRARAQGLLLGGAGGAAANISSGAAIFDMEYARWLEDDERQMSELRGGLQSHLSEGELGVVVGGYVRHMDEIFRLKEVAARTDVFHLFSGAWASPAERCFLWMGGFRPSELIKMLVTQLDTLTEQQQFMGLYSLQQSSQQAEDALTQGLDQLQQSLVDTVAGITVPHGMHQMALALAKLSNLRGFVRQADNLRQQTLHQLCRILTVRQAARCFLVIGEYYSRLRALSHLWASRPRESMIGGTDNTCQTSTDLQMVHPASQNQFPTF